MPITSLLLPNKMCDKHFLKTNIVNQTILGLAVGCLISLSAWAQETVAVNTGDIVSPELKNQAVTFKLLAPNTKEVVVEADFLKKLNGRPRLV